MMVVRFVRGITDHFLIRLPEYACSAILWSYGQTLLRPGNTFDTHPNYDVMRQIANEDTWGYVISIIAGLRICALLLNGTFPWFKRVSPHVRALCCTLSVGVWFALSLSLYAGNPASPASRTYGWLMLVDLVLAIYVARQAGHAESKHRNGR